MSKEQKRILKKVRKKKKAKKERKLKRIKNHASKKIPNPPHKKRTYQDIFYENVKKELDQYSPCQRSFLFLTAVHVLATVKYFGEKASPIIYDVTPSVIEEIVDFLRYNVNFKIDYNWTGRDKEIKKLAEREQPLITKQVERRDGWGGRGNVIKMTSDVARTINVYFNDFVNNLSNLWEDVVYRKEEIVIGDFTKRFATPGTQEYTNVTRKKARELPDEIIDFIKGLPNHLKYTLYVYHRENPFKKYKVSKDPIHGNIDDPLAPLDGLRLDVLFANPEIYKVCEDGFNAYNQDVHKHRFGMKTPICQDDHNMNKLHQWSIIRKLQLGSEEVIKALKTNVNDFIAKITAMFKCWKFRSCKDPPNYSQCETCRKYRPDLSGVQI